MPCRWATTRANRVHICVTTASHSDPTFLSAARTLLHQGPSRHLLKTRLCHWAVRQTLVLEMVSTSTVYKTQPNADGRIKARTQLSTLHQITWMLRAWLDCLAPDLVLPGLSSLHQCRQWPLTLHC